MNEQGFIPGIRASGAAQQLIAAFPDYTSAQRLVDRMSDDGLPVEHVRIIGEGSGWSSR